jgi:poly-gamma-glutamate synthesis protein (capsule biosynthesis protein)
MAMTVALAGDTMLGRGVAEHLREFGPRSVFAPEIRDVISAAEVCVVNLECCISDRGEPWPAPGKPFFFRAPPVAAETLAWLGVDCVTLANNHALDFGRQALLDTRALLSIVGVESVGAGASEDEARQPVVLDAAGSRLAVVGVTDHPADYAAGPDSAGVAYADLREGLPGWLSESVEVQRRAAGVDAVLVSPHWGPNMATGPLGYVREAGRALVAAGATVVAGHSAHVFQGVAGSIAYDLGDFVDDYRVDPYLRNDLGILALLTLDGDGPRRIQVVPLGLDFCFTRLATEEEHAWIARRLVTACAALGSEWEIRDEKDQIVLDRPRP